jgi:HTH-type transcriptional regulator/antitoxin HigA
MTYSITKISSDEDYQKVLDRLEQIFDSIKDTPEGKELNHLSSLIEDWEDSNYGFDFLNNL